jgi:hypothetical protein
VIGLASRHAASFAQEDEQFSADEGLSLRVIGELGAIGAFDPKEPYIELRFSATMYADES